MKKALVIIDFVNDFVETTGTLTCGEPAQAIDRNISKIVDAFSENEDFIVVASDSHTQNDEFNPEYKLFPEHCTNGTWGSELFGTVLESVKKVKREQLINVQKSRYSSFAGTNLDLKLRERNVTEIYLVGVCSDICVLHTAIDAYNLGYKINIFEKGVASFNNEGHNFAINHFKNVLGATVL